MFMNNLLTFLKNLETLFGKLPEILENFFGYVYKNVNSLQVANPQSIK